MFVLFQFLELFLLSLRGPEIAANGGAHEFSNNFNFTDTDLQVSIKNLNETIDIELLYTNR